MQKPSCSLRRFRVVAKMGGISLSVIAIFALGQDACFSSGGSGGGGAGGGDNGGGGFCKVFGCTTSGTGGAGGHVAGFGGTPPLPDGGGTGGTGGT